MTIPDFVVELPPLKADRRGVRHFLRFLRRTGHRFKIDLEISENSDGTWLLRISGPQRVNTDSFLQELVFNRGLYYYLCSIDNRRSIARNVVKPIFEELLRWTFEFAYPVPLRKHLLEGERAHAAGEFGHDGFSQEFEVLHQEYRLKMVTGWEFIRNLDDLLTEFMLVQLGHKKGNKSPKFHVLVDLCGKQNILRNQDVQKIFNRVHELRTLGLHRLQRQVSDVDLAQIAHRMDVVFDWLDDYWEAQLRKTVLIGGQHKRRIRYGDEVAFWKRRKGSWWKEHPSDIESWWGENPCHDCDVVRGELHLEGCDVEVCPGCGGQFMGCACHDD